jgi:hypothetical protein
MMGNVIQGIVNGLYDAATNKLIGVKDQAEKNHLFPGVPIYQSAVPIIIVPIGTVATNGTFTSGTTLAQTYAEAWVYLPTGALKIALADAPAGLYYAKFSNTTTAVIYTNYVAVPGTPATLARPTSLTVAKGSNSEYVQVLSALSLLTITIPGGFMGLNGKLVVDGMYRLLSNSNNKTIDIVFGGTSIFTKVETSIAGAHVVKEVWNRNNLASQICTNLTGYGPTSYTSASFLLATVDTNTDKELVYKMTMAVGTDYMVIEALSVIVEQG